MLFSVKNFNKIKLEKGVFFILILPKDTIGTIIIEGNFKNLGNLH